MTRAQLTLPGFVHDVCSAIHPLGMARRFFPRAPLPDYGLEWIYSVLPLAHPLDDGTAAIAERSIAATAERLGSRWGGVPSADGALVRGWDAARGRRTRGRSGFSRHPVALARFGLRAIWSARRPGRGFFRERTGPGFRGWGGGPHHSAAGGTLAQPRRVWRWARWGTATAGPCRVAEHSRISHALAAAYCARSEVKSPTASGCCEVGAPTAGAYGPAGCYAAPAAGDRRRRAADAISPRGSRASATARASSSSIWALGWPDPVAGGGVPPGRHRPPRRHDRRVRGREKQASWQGRHRRAPPSCWWPSRACSMLAARRRQAYRLGLLPCATRVGIRHDRADRGADGALRPRFRDLNPGAQRAGLRRRFQAHNAKLHRRRHQRRRKGPPAVPGPARAGR